ncbi:MAG: T9SS type A sorting domain-containing protein [Bacteroidota bacterium]|jgi:hypothetical protein
MKKRYFNLLVLITAFIGNNLFGQLCTTTIFPAPGMTKITTNQSALSSPSGEAFWICSGLTVTVVNSAGSLFVCEDNVTLIFSNTSGDDVFAKNGCVIVNNSNSDIGVQCDTSQVTLQNNSSGTITLTSNCPSLLYDYSLVGGSACQGISGVEDYKINELLIRVYPNPATSYFTLETQTSEELKLSIFNSLGQEVLRNKKYKSGNLIQLTGISEGVYWFELRNENSFGYGRINIFKD